MAQLVLLACLHDDGANTLLSAATYREKQDRVTLINRDGVALLSDNHILLDPTIAHATLVQLCAILEQKSWPYLLLRMDGPASLASGKPTEEVSSLLAGAGVQFVSQW